MIIRKRSTLLALFALSAGLAIAVSPANADETQAAETTNAETSAVPPPVPPTETKSAAAADLGVTLSPGPLEEKRAKLLETIKTAKSYGFGIGAYVSAFQSLDDRVKAGADEKEVQTRLDSIVNGLSEQVKRSQQLKTQKPAPPVAASSPPSSSTQSSIGKALSGPKGAAMIETLKDKWFGGQIPDSIKSKIPPGIDPNSITQEQAMELFKKYGGGH